MTLDQFILTVGDGTINGYLNIDKILNGIPVDINIINILYNMLNLNPDKRKLPYYNNNYTQFIENNVKKFYFYDFKLTGYLIYVWNIITYLNSKYYIIVMVYEICYRYYILMNRILSLDEIYSIIYIVRKYLLNEIDELLLLYKKNDGLKFLYLTFNILNTIGFKIYNPYLNDSLNRAKKHSNLLKNNIYIPNNNVNDWFSDIDNMDINTLNNLYTQRIVYLIQNETVYNILNNNDIRKNAIFKIIELVGVKKLNNKYIHLSIYILDKILTTEVFTGDIIQLMHYILYILIKINDNKISPWEYNLTNGLIDYYNIYLKYIINYNIIPYDYSVISFILNEDIIRKTLNILLIYLIESNNLNSKPSNIFFSCLYIMDNKFLDKITYNIQENYQLIDNIKLTLKNFSKNIFYKNINISDLIIDLF